MSSPETMLIEGEKGGCYHILSACGTQQSPSPVQLRNSSCTGYQIPNQKRASPQSVIGDLQYVSDDTMEALGKSVHHKDSLGLNRGCNPSQGMA
jgi:hypothetical protein